MHNTNNDNNNNNSNNKNSDKNNKNNNSDKNTCQPGLVACGASLSSSAMHVQVKEDLGWTLHEMQARHVCKQI